MLKIRFNRLFQQAAAQKKGDTLRHLPLEKTKSLKNIFIS